MEAWWRTSFVGSTFLLLILIVFYQNIAVVESCNEIVCASIVSKCMLTQSCRCELKDCSCCKDCLNCLGREYFEDCCSCVELCPKPKNTTASLSQKCHVEDFEGIPGLFNAVAFPTPLPDYDAYTFEVNFDAVLAGSSKQNKNFKYYLRSNDDNAEEAAAKTEKKPDTASVNCTVLFVPDCMPWTKCQGICRSIGSSGYRWFHNGCCECVGYTCINYGMNESRCRRCTDSPDDFERDDDENLDESAQDYGDNVGPFDGSVGNNF